MHGGLDWIVFKKNRINIIFSTKRYLTKDKYLTLYLFVSYKSYNNPEFNLNNIKLFINITTKKSSNRLKTFISEYNPILIDLFDIVDVDF